MLHGFATVDEHPDPVSQVDGPGQNAPRAHAAVPVHDTSHAHAWLHMIPLLQLLSPAHVTSHRCAPHAIEPEHEPGPVHVTSQREALPHATPPKHEPEPRQTTSHGIPAGHRMPAPQPPSAQVNVQAPLMQVPPTPVQLAPHTGTNASARPASTMTQ